MQFENAYKTAIKEAKEHYENFPVISFFLPAELIPHVAVIYKFARTADDIADEGDLTYEQRLEKLNEYRRDFRLALSGRKTSEYWKSIVNTIEKYNLNSIHFFDLLDAFEQDIKKNRYATLIELLDYCNKSANPVGRLLLEMFDIRDSESFKQSDNICTALQLTNMWQDVSVDLLKGRIYLPADILNKYGVSETQVSRKLYSSEFADMMKYLVEYTTSLFYNGKALLNKLPVKFKIQINATIYGGLKILKKINKIDFNVLNYRVNLHKMDYVLLFIKSLLTYE